MFLFFVFIPFGMLDETVESSVFFPTSDSCLVLLICSS